MVKKGIGPSMGRMKPTHCPRIKFRNSNGGTKIVAISSHCIFRRPRDHLDGEQNVLKQKLLTYIVVLQMLFSVSGAIEGAT